MATDYVRIPITADVLARAKQAAAKIPVYHGSHRGMAANLVGFLGEIVVAHWLRERGFTVNRVNLIGHDIEVFDSMGHRIYCDVKTKDRTVTPKPDYEASIPQYVWDAQAPDYYTFVSLLRPKHGAPLCYTDAYIVGAMSRLDFEKARYAVDVGRKINGANIWTPMWNVQIGNLDEPGSFPPRD